MKKKTKKHKTICLHVRFNYVYWHALRMLFEYVRTRLPLRGTINLHDLFRRDDFSPYLLPILNERNTWENTVVKQKENSPGWNVQDQQKLMNKFAATNADPKHRKQITILNNQNILFSSSSWTRFDAHKTWRGEYLIGLFDLRRSRYLTPKERLRTNSRSGG